VTPYNDEVDRVFLGLRKARAEIVARIAKGEAKPENILGGYFHEVGTLRGIEIAEEIVRSVLVDFTPPEAERYAERRIVTEY
jgi:hypothetical protein